ncbi:MAG: helix-turn-helix transcriptional regulator [Nodosilinea sp.]
MVTTRSSTTFKPSLQSALSASKEFPAAIDVSLLNAVLEGFADGVLILTEDGTCLHSNQEGKAFCRDLGAPSQRIPTVPECLWSMCNHLLESRNLFPENSLVLTQGFTCPAGHQIRARVQWLDFPTSPAPYLLVLLENQTRSARSSALLESIQYNLTPREKDVWVLRRASYSYEAIAHELYITLNTVKRHLKSIHAKRRQVLDEMAN